MTEKNIFESERRRVAVVTGGTSGIGLSLCTLFSSKGIKTYALARKERELPDGVSFISCDVSDLESVKAAMEKVALAEGKIDLVCANAGMGISGAAEETEPAEAEKQMKINFFGAFFTAKASMPYLKETKGTLVFTSSVAGLLPVPFQSFYSASKAAVNSLSLTLANEVKPFGVRVFAVLPGDVCTGFTDAREKSVPGASYKDRVERSVLGMEKDERGGMSPDAVAKKVYSALKKKHPRPYYVVGAEYRFFCFLGKFFPLKMINWLIGKIYG